MACAGRAGRAVVAGSVSAAFAKSAVEEAALALLIQGAFELGERQFTRMSWVRAS